MPCGLGERIGIPCGLGERKEGTGEPAVLRLACASRKAATEIRWDESEALLAPRDLVPGGFGGVSDAVEDVGDDAPICRNDFRLNDTSSGIGKLGLDKSGLVGVELADLDQLKNGRFAEPSGRPAPATASESIGRERVERALLASPYAPKAGWGCCRLSSVLVTLTLSPASDPLLRPNPSRILLDDATGAPALGRLGDLASFGCK